MLSSSTIEQNKLQDLSFVPAPVGPGTGARLPFAGDGCMSAHACDQTPLEASSGARPRERPFSIPARAAFFDTRASGLFRYPRERPFR
jgi:hypothetical protein